MNSGTEVHADLHRAGLNITLRGPILSIRTKTTPEVHADLHRVGLNITLRGPILSIRTR
jgi:hypothetical protein